MMWVINSIICIFLLIFDIYYLLNIYTWPNSTSILTSNIHFHHSIEHRDIWAKFGYFLLLWDYWSL